MRSSVKSHQGCSSRLTCPQLLPRWTISHSQGVCSSSVVEQNNRCVLGRNNSQHPPQRTSTPCQALPAAASIPAAVSAGVAGSLGPEWLCISIAAATAYTAACFAMMLFRPAAILPHARSKKIVIPLAILYTALLINSWSPDLLSILMPGSLQEGLSDGFKVQFMPKLDGISSLFSRVPTSVSVLVHLLAVNLFMGCTAFLQGIDEGIPTAHTLLLCMVCGPLGLLSLTITKALCGWFPFLKRAIPVVVLPSNGGSVTINPYAT